MVRAVVMLVSAALVLGTAPGCSRSVSSAPSFSPAEERLYAIGRAYIQANSKLGRGAKNFAEIKSFLPADAPNDLLRSPNDGEEFVILWGVDFNKLPVDRDPYFVGAYEKTGTSGKHYVLRFPIGVVTMTDAELKAATFPPGFSPPR